MPSLPAANFILELKRLRNTHTEGGGERESERKSEREREREGRGGPEHEQENLARLLDTHPYFLFSITPM